MPAFILESIDRKGGSTILAAHFERGPIATMRRAIGRSDGNLRIVRFPIRDFPEVQELRDIADGAEISPIVYLSIKAVAR